MLLLLWLWLPLLLLITLLKELLEVLGVHEEPLALESLLEGGVVAAGTGTVVFSSPPPLSSQPTLSQLPDGMLYGTEVAAVDPRGSGGDLLVLLFPIRSSSSSSERACDRLLRVLSSPSNTTTRVLLLLDQSVVVVGSCGADFVVLVQVVTYASGLSEDRL